MRQWIGPILLGVLVGAGEWFKRYPSVVEDHYSRRFYPMVSGILNGWTGRVPFSLFEVLIWGAFLFGAAVLAVLWFRRPQLRPSAGVRVFRTGLTAGLAFLLVFNGVWGFNYYREPLQAQLRLPQASRDVEALEALCERLTDRANVLAQQVPRGNDGVMRLQGDRDHLLERVDEGYRNASKRTGLFLQRYRPPKFVTGSALMSWMGISGMYAPFTAEAQVNGRIPDPLLPATAMHEMAHLHGYAREDEANFIAWMTCSYHPDVDYRYSGTLLALIYSMNALHGQDPERYQALKDRYAPEVQADLKANRDFWKAYEGPLERFQDRVNDRYLKTNGQTDGVESYGRMVDLLLASDFPEP